VHYLETGDPCVAGANPLHPRDRVSVKQLRRDGLGDLESADINRDGWVDAVDIVDFALLVDDFGGPRAADARSNFDANAFVNNADFSYIAVHYLETGDPCVAGANPLHPRDRVSIKQLRREGLGRLESADINHDGWVDAVDVQMFMQGRRGGGAPRDSVGNAW